jgi:hypothetical protein
VSLYLETDRHAMFLVNGESFEDAAAWVLELLVEGWPWVRLRSEDETAWISEWTVIERGDDGIPTQIGYRGFDGALEVIDNREA